jgi:hypothetical protein
MSKVASLVSAEQDAQERKQILLQKLKTQIPRSKSMTKVK